MNYNQRTGIPYVRERLYGVNLINSPYLYEDPYTTIAEDDSVFYPSGSAAWGDGWRKLKTNRQTRVAARKAKRAAKKQAKSGVPTPAMAPTPSPLPFGTPVQGIQPTPAGGGIFQSSVGPTFAANYITQNESALLQALPPRRTSYYTQSAQTQSAAFRPFVANIKPELKSEMQANADAGRAEKTNKTLVIGGITLATLLLGGGGFLLWKKRQGQEGPQQGAQNFPQYHY
jgi:LPXTG-motif cell wall-anchored protein